MENPPDLAYDCMKGSRILGAKQTKPNQISQTKQNKKYSLAVTGYWDKGVQAKDSQASNKIS